MKGVHIHVIIKTGLSEAHLKSDYKINFLKRSYVGNVHTIVCRQFATANKIVQ